MSAMLDLTTADEQRQPIRKSDGTPLKVLYALDSFPQLSESYINAEIQRMQSWGVHIEVWSKGDPRSKANCDVVVHRGSLYDTITLVQPDIVHTHWTQTALKYKDAAKRAGLPLTARGHWHFVPKQIQRVEDEDTITRLYMFPHLAEKWSSQTSKILPMLSCYHHEWLAPRVAKNRKMIVRTAACKRPKDLDGFIRIASKLPGYRSVLIVCSLGPNDLFRELEALNKELGSPVEIVSDISYEEVAAYMSEAGIYLHTYDKDVSFGMPVSIAEAMAAGCTIIARDVYGAAEYAGEAGRLYTTEDEAVELVKATEGWSDEQWARAEQLSRERARARFDDRDVLQPLLETWQELGEKRVAEANAAVPLFEKLRRWSGVGYKRI
ncbi:glycosyltransferase [Mangrovibrevibacter kandeliae]|uniref:glycosyltransferase n=1 Tax=Mangrovibrevibacter kandeliae TaxID=2968473 RepID=UPI002117E72D|nr:glycosyltransferase [Aurantimonas sp. CSK15Z-1]